MRFFDILISIFGLIFLAPVIFLITIICALDTGSPFFYQKRVGLNKKPFFLIKFRTMKIGTPSLPTHQLSLNYSSRTGNLIRKYKFDEILQFINVLKGDMSIVGPRPCLLSQEEIINKRFDRGLYRYRPGITGLAQIKGINMSMIDAMIDLDCELMYQINIQRYFYIIFKTFIFIIK